MNRPHLLLPAGLLLLLLGVVVGRLSTSDHRPHAEGDSHALLTAVREAPTRGDATPLLVGRDGQGPGGDPASALRELLETTRAERDRLAAEVERLREQGKRGETLTTLEALQSAANEQVAIATARNTISAQAQVQASAKIDVDGDGTGEYGGFLELSGAVAGRVEGGAPLVPPVMSSAFRTLTGKGEVYRNGYLYRIHLPDPRGNGVGEEPGGFTASQIDADLAEATWCMYAWPAVRGVTGQRTFFVNQGGDVFATDDSRYAGPGNGPAPSAAFQQPGIVGAPGDPGNDRAAWTPVN